jgi:pimeloyl-ACP methyl ester carboxylesterase
MNGSDLPTLSGRILSGIEPTVVVMTNTYVLVPGFWTGGWVWRPVTDALRARGHEVYPMTLTGLGERAHLASPDTDLETHVDDVTNLLRYEDLHDVVLVGHSYGGLVTTAVADRMPDRVQRLAYVDTGPLPDGSANADFAPPEERARQERLVAAGDGWRLPPPPWADLASTVDGVDAETVARLTQRSVAQPWRTATTPVRLTGAWEALPRLGVLASFTIAQTEAMASTAPLFRHMAGERWTFVELPTWHWPMLSRPAELADILASSRVG